MAPPIQPAPPPAEGQGRLVVEVTDGQIPVQRVQMQAKQVASGRFRFFEAPELFCPMSPCASDVAIGNVLLTFPVIGKPDITETELVYIGKEPSVYRRTLSVYRDDTGGTRVLGIIATALGGTSMMTGTALLPIGLAKDNDGMTLAGGLTLGVGAALLTVGILAIRADSPTYRPGSSNHFPLAP